MSKLKNNTQIGLDSKKSEALANELNSLLANFQLYYQNLRGLHWNINGKHFFELHVKFEELYNDVQLKIDLVAERILTLGFSPCENCCSISCFKFANYYFIRKSHSENSR